MNALLFRIQKYNKVSLICREKYCAVTITVKSGGSKMVLLGTLQIRAALGPF